MIKFVSGDIFKSGADVLVNPVNCDGVMGKGLALKFKTMFPENYRMYRERCLNSELRPGMVYTTMIGSPAVCNFPTKLHWKNLSKIVYIEYGLKALNKEIVFYKRFGKKSIAIPPLGCGLGGLQWSTVKKLIEEILGDIEDFDILVYEPIKGRFEKD